MTNPKIALTAEDRTAAAFAAVSKRVDKLGFNLNTLKTATVGALGALAVPISAAALIGLTSDARDAIDGIKDLAEVAGSTVENISALDRIARATGGSFDQVAGSLVKFNQVLKDADPDKGAGAVLKALNLDIDELKRLDPAEALRLTAVALQGYSDNGDKARAIQELFGKSVQETAPFLRDLAEAGKLQAAITTEQAEEVDKFNKQLSQLKTSAEDAGRSITIDLVTSINEAIERFKVGRKEGKGFFEIGFQQYRENVREFYGLEDDEEAQTAPAAGGGRGFVNPAFASTLPDLVIPKEPDKKKGGTPKDPYAEAQRYIDALYKQLEATEKLTEREQALRDLQLGRLGKVTEKQRETILNTAAEIDAAKEFEKIAEEFKKLDEERLERERERKDLIKDLVDAGATEQLEKQRDVLKTLTEAYEKGELGIVGSEEALRKYTEAAQAFLGISDEQVKKVDELDQFTRRAAENIQDYLGDSFADALEGNFDNIGASFTSLINKMVAEAAAAKVARYLFGDLMGAGPSGGGGGDGAIGGVFKEVFGGLFGGIPQLDTGTDFVPRDMLAVIHKGEKITPASQNAGNRNEGANPRQLIVNVTATPGMQRETALQQGRRIGQGIQQGMDRNG